MTVQKTISQLRDVLAAAKAEQAANPEREDLAKVLESMMAYTPESSTAIRLLASGILAAGYQRARPDITLAELTTLPPMSIVIDERGVAYQKDRRLDGYWWAMDGELMTLEALSTGTDELTLVHLPKFAPAAEEAEGTETDTCKCTNHCPENPSENPCPHCRSLDIYDPCPVIGFGCGTDCGDDEHCTPEQQKAADS